MRVVELADEFGATTAETLDWCAAAGVPATDGGTELTDQQCASVRTARADGTSAPVFAVPPAPPLSSPPPFAASVGPAARPGSPPPSAAASPPGSALAMLALIAAILSICVPVVPAVIAIVAGTVAKRSAAASPVKSQATGRATASQVLGVITIVLWLGLYGLVYKSSHTTATLKDGTTVSVRKVLPESVGSPDCYVTQQDALVKELYVADCDGPHDAEIFAGPFGFGVDLGPDPARWCEKIAFAQGVVADDVRVSVLQSGDVMKGVLCVARHSDGRPYTGRLVNP